MIRVLTVFITAPTANMDAPVNSIPTAHPPRKPSGVDHRLEDLLFPALLGWKRSVALFLYYLLIIIALLLIYGRGDFTTAPFIYQGF